MANLVQSADAFQQKHAWLAFPIGVYRRFGDDQAGNLAALIAYYAFFSIFPLLLALTTILGFVLGGDPKLEHKVFDSAFGQFPIIGTNSVAHPLTGSVFGLIVGLVLALYSGLAVANSAQTAFNTVWDVPRKQWPGFVPRLARSGAIIVVGGGGLIVTTLLSGTLTGAGSYGFGLGIGLRIVGAVIAIALNTALFAVIFSWLTATDESWRIHIPGAVVAATAWFLLQLVGGALVAHKLKGAQGTYGQFATVIGLLFWFYLLGQITLFAAEINVVRRQRLWPRGLKSFANQPTTDADRRAYAGYVRRNRFASADEQQVDVDFGSAPEGTEARDEE